MRSETRSDWREYGEMFGVALMAVAVVLVALCVLFSAGCAKPPTPAPPMPPRPAGTPWTIGETFAPFSADEWAHVAPDRFTWRVGSDQWNAVTHALLIVTAEDDAELAAVTPFLETAWAVELGNEPNFSQDCQSVNAWYLKAIQSLRNAGFAGPLVTAGVGNLDDDTLAWAQCSLAGVPSDVWFGWHAYGTWQPQVGKLLAMLGTRAHLMTESGHQVSEAGSDAEVASLVSADLQGVFASGALGYFNYQMHDGAPGTVNATFGLHAYDGHWRPTEQVLVGAEAWH